MIISASYRTDIPAFYGRWFVNRFHAGFARVANPYGGAAATVPLRDGVDGFVFWTRNAQPFADALEMVREAEIPFVVSQTLTAYPRPLEGRVIAPEHALAHMAALAARFGPAALVWRYDPILFSSLTPLDFHLDTFARLAARLEGVVDECVISFATIYRKTARNLDAAARAQGLAWEDPPDEAKRRLASQLVALAARHRMRLSVCAQAALTEPGSHPAACIDARRLEAVAAGWGMARTIVARIKGNRPDCACHQSRDIGAYDTCPHGCVYCYAVGSRDQAMRRHARHDPWGESLIPPTLPCLHNTGEPLK